MNSKTRRTALVESLKDKEYRDAFVASHVSDAIAFQIRAMRRSRGWKQDDLGKRSGMAQEGIARLENPNYGKYSLDTLKRLASAFDTALIVRFAPYSDLVNWTTDLSPETLNVPSFAEDRALLQRETVMTAYDPQSNLVHFFVDVAPEYKRASQSEEPAIHITGTTTFHAFSVRRLDSAEEVQEGEPAYA